MKNLRNVLPAALAIMFVTGGFSQSKQKEMKTNNSATSTKEIIVDVRTKGEWMYDGHADCAVNYPLDQFDSKIEELKKYDKVILVCRSGGRAGVAQMKLLNAGFKNKIENLGPWQNVTCTR